MTRRFGWLVAALLGLALLLRVGYAYKLHAHQIVRLADFWDPDSYDRMGQRWLDTGSFTDSEGRIMLEREPFYPIFLAGAHAAFGRSWVVPVVINVLLGVVACWLCYALTLALFGSEAMALAALLFGTIYPEWIYYSAFAYRETLVTVLSGWWLWLWATAGEDAAPRRYALMGFVFGLLCLTRSPMIPVGGLFCLLLLRRLPRRAWLKTAAVFALCAALTNAPWVWRNYKITGKLVMGASLGGLVMYMSLLKDYDKPEEAIEAKVYGTNDPVVTEASAKPNAAEADRVYYAACWKILKQKPGLFLSTFVRKSLKLWRLYPSPNRQYTHGYRLLQAVGLLSNGPLTLLAVLGGVWAWRRRGADFAVLLPVSMTVIYGLFWSTTRYRAPLMISVIPLAAYALLTLRESGFIKRS